MAVTTWDGSSSTDWNTAANWDTGAVPTSADDVIIPDDSTTANDCTLSATGGNPKNVKSLQIQANGTIVGGGIAIRVYGENSNGYAVDNDGIIDGGSTLHLIIKTDTTTALDLNGTSGSFTNVEIDHASCVAQLAENASILGTLTVTLGEFDTASDRSLTVTGNVLNYGTLTLNGSAFSAAFFRNYSTGVVPASTGQHTFTDALRNDNSYTFTNGNTLLTGRGVGNSGYVLDDQGSTMNYNGGTINIGNGTDIGGNTNIRPQASHDLNNLIINCTNSRKVILATACDIAGDLTITAGELDTSGSNLALTVTGLCKVYGTLTGNSSTITVGALHLDGGTYSAPDSSGSTIINDESGNQAFDNDGTFTHNGGTVTITTAGNSQIDWIGTGSGNLNNLTYSGGAILEWTVNGGTIDGNLNITNGTLQSSNGNKALTVTGDVTVGDGTGSANTAILGNASEEAAQTFGSLTIDSDGKYNATSGTTTITNIESGASRSILNNGTFTNNDGTVLFNGSMDQKVSMDGTGNLHNVTLNKSNNDFVFIDNSTTVEGDLDITMADNTRQCRPSSTSGAITVTGDVIVREGILLRGANDCTGAMSFGSLEIQSGGIYAATSGTTTLNGDFDNTGTFTHNSGLVSMIASGGNITINGTGTVEPVFHDLSYEGSSDVRVAKDITVEDTLNINGSRFLFGSTSGGGQTDAILTMGTTSTKGTLTVQSGKTFDFYIYSNSQTDKLQGASTLFPVDVTVNGTMNFSVTTSEPDTGKVQLANINYIGSLTLDNGDKVELTGDCEFDAVTVSTGATLDLNGQRAEFGGNFSLTGTLSDTATGAFAYFKGTYTRTGGHSDLTNAGTTFVAEGGGTSDYYNPVPRRFVVNTDSTITLNNPLNQASAGSSDYIVASGIVNANNQNINGKNQIVIATGGTHQAGSSTITCLGDFTTSGGLLGASALTFDGTDDQVVIADDNSLDFTTAMTIECWVKTTDAEGTFAVKQGGYYRIETVGGKASFLIYTGSNKRVTGTSTVNDGKWHHIAATYDQTNMKIYVDGKLENTLAETGTISTSSTQLILGSEGSATYFTGSLDEIRFFNVAKTEAQIRTDMFQGGTLASSTGLVARYKCDEGTGTSLEDSSSNTNTGTLSSAFWAGGGTFTQGTSTLKFSKSGAQTLNFYSSDNFNNITIDAGSTTSLNGFGLGSGAPLDCFGNLIVSGTLTDSGDNSIMKLRTADKTHDFSGTLTGLYSMIVDISSGNLNIPALNTPRLRFSTSVTGTATGNLTITEELQVDSNTTFIANGKTITAKLVDLNNGTFNLGAGNLILSHTGGSNGFDTNAASVLAAGPGATISGSSAGTIFKSQNNFSVVGKIENLDVTNEELKVTGQVINCTGDIHQYFPTIDHAQQLDADTADDRDVRLGRDLDKNTELINS